MPSVPTMKVAGIGSIQFSVPWDTAGFQPQLIIDCFNSSPYAAHFSREGLQPIGQRDLQVAAAGESLFEDVTERAFGHQRPLHLRPVADSKPQSAARSMLSSVAQAVPRRRPAAL